MLAVLLTANCYAQSDFEIAQEFMSKKGVELVPNKSSATRGTDVPYSIFNGSEGKGFCIVANGNVVGYDTNNTINKDDMPCCLKELLLKSYSATAKTRSGYTPDWWTPRNVEPIETLIKTHWGQTPPYINIVKRTGICGVVAWCQILHYFRVPQTYLEVTSAINGEILPITSFNHDLMLNDYEYGQYTEKQAYEVAKFYNYYYNIDYEGIEEAYGMSKISHINDKDNFYLGIDKHLEEKIPILVVGVIVDGTGHAFILDGRDSEGRYHVNFGWGGSCDGYYVVSDSKKNLKTYNGDNDILNLMNSCAYDLTMVVPRLFSWSYTTDIYKPNFNITNVSNTDVYNLQGIKMGNSLDGLPKGIYIQNGKKIIKN